jgi:hypothetical protein
MNTKPHTQITSYDHGFNDAVNGSGYRPPEQNMLCRDEYITELHKYDDGYCAGEEINK